MPNSKLLTSAVAALLAAIGPAHAITPLFGGGGTLAEKVYRDIFNCYGNHSGSDTTVGLTGFAARCSTVVPYSANVEPLYLGSGSGKNAFLNHDASRFTDGPRTPDAVPVASTSDFGPFYGTGTGAGWVPNATDAGPFFPAVSIVSSAEPLSAGDIATYDGASGGHWGAPIQVPAMITVIAIAFHQTSTWKESGVAVGGSSSNVNLATDTLCGIFTGAITDWSDAAFKATNGGNQLGSGPIKVLYRGEGGGTFLLSNALVHQCARTSHPVPASWQTAPGNSSGAGNDVFFTNVASAGLLPANFSKVPNGQTMESVINGTVGAIGYDSPDFALLVDAAGPKAANLQTFASIGATPLFLAPTAQNTGAIVGAAKPPANKPATCDAAHATGIAPFLLSGDGICADNPLNWGLAFPAPVSAKAYPIGGFGFLDTYTCFASAAARDAIAGTTVGSFGLLRWYFGSATDNSTQVKTELNRNGFSIVPGAWVSGAKRLLTAAPATKIGIPGQLKTGCAAVTGGA